MRVCARVHEPSLSALQQRLLSSACGAVDCVTLQGNLDALQSTLGNVHMSDELQFAEETKEEVSKGSSLNSSSISIYEIQLLFGF